MKASTTKAVRVGSKRDDKKAKVFPEFKLDLFSNLQNPISFTLKQSYVKDRYTFLSCDPGISNFAFVIFSISAESALKPLLKEGDGGIQLVEETFKSVTIEEFGFLKNPLLDLKHHNIFPIVETLLKGNKNLKKHNPDYVVLERFQARGVTRGPVNEIINYHIAFILADLLEDSSFTKSKRVGRLLIPAQWKRYYALDKENSFLEELYGKLKLESKDFKKEVKVHHIDSLMLGLYLYLDTFFPAVKDLQEFKEKLFSCDFLKKFVVEEKPSLVKKEPIKRAPKNKG